MANIKYAPAVLDTAGWEFFNPRGATVNRSARSLHVPVVRFSHSMAFLSQLRSFGAPTDRYLAMSKLPTLCEDPDYLIPVARMYAFIDTAMRKEAPLLGWLVGESAGDQQFSIALRRKLETAPSLLTALQSLVGLLNSESSDIDVGLRERREDIVLYTRYASMRGAPGYAVAQSYQISVFISVVRLFLGKNWVPEEIGLECQRTTRELPGKFHAGRFFPQSPFAYFTVPKSCLHHSLADVTPTKGTKPDANSVLLRMDQLDDLELIRRLLRSYLADGYVSEKFAAELLGTSVRSLSRRLAGHGTTYKKVIDGVRFQAAKEHLENPDMQVLDVAHAVGFKDPGDFTRMFRRVGGLTPSQFRRAMTRSPD